MKVNGILTISFYKNYLPIMKMSNPSLPCASFTYVCLAKQKKAMANLLMEQIKKKGTSYAKFCLTVTGA